MNKIRVELGTPELVEDLGVNFWGKWECGVTEFDWHYIDKEICYILDGEAEVTSPYQHVKFGTGDIVSFPKGLDCHWKVSKPVTKRYKFGD